MPSNAIENKVNSSFLMRHPSAALLNDHWVQSNNILYLKDNHTSQKKKTLTTRMVKNDLRNSSLKIHLCLEKHYFQARMVKNVVDEG